MLSHEQWPLHLLQSRDRDLCESFIDAFYADVYRWFRLLTNRSDEAADLTQETFLAFWRSIDSGRPDTPARAWLLGIGRNLWRRAQGNRCGQYSTNDSNALNQQLDSTTPSPQDIALRAELVSEVHDALSELPVDLREAVTLRYWQDFRYQEIGEILEISTALARWRVFQGRQQLRRLLLARTAKGEIR